MGNSDLPSLSSSEVIQAFGRAGWEVVPRRGKGSHTVLKKSGVRVLLTIPQHKDIKRALLAQQIKQAGLTHDEFRALL